MLFAASACNAISGADGIVLEEGPDDGDHPLSGLAQGTGGTGTGTATGGGGLQTTTETGPTTTSGTTTTASTTTSSTTTTSTTDPCAYPGGPYGVNVGNVVSPSLSWQGYPEKSSQIGTVSIKDYFDCDGSKGINALMVDTSQYG
jgi:hypothetical protein